LEEWNTGNNTSIYAALVIIMKGCTIIDLHQIPERRQKIKQKEQLATQRQDVVLVAGMCIS